MADLVGANLAHAMLVGADLSGARLNRADLAHADLTKASLTRADLTKATLTRADLTRAILFSATLTGADLTRAELTRAELPRADLNGADLTGARLTEGVACGRAIDGYTGGHHWWAVAMKGGGAVLQYGCECHPLVWWLAQGPQLAVHHGYPAEFWAEGPAVAIAAAVELSQALPPVSAGEPAARLGGIGLQRAQRRKLKKFVGYPLPV